MEGFIDHDSDSDNPFEKEEKERVTTPRARDEEDIVISVEPRRIMMDDRDQTEVILLTLPPPRMGLMLSHLGYIQG